MRLTTFSGDGFSGDGLSLITRLTMNSRPHRAAAGLLPPVLAVCRIGLALAPFLWSASALAQDSQAQNSQAQNPQAKDQPKETVRDGYTIHQSVDLGVRVTDTSGSLPMYDTLVNLQTGPRILGQTIDM